MQHAILVTGGTGTLGSRVVARLRETPDARCACSAGTAARAVRAGVILAPDRAVGRRTWEELLTERVGSPGVGASNGSPKPSESGEQGHILNHQ